MQNAIDAVRIQAVRDKRSVTSGYRIDIVVDGSKCEIHDTGNGMTKEQLRTNFWTMGASGKHSEEAKRAGCIARLASVDLPNFGVCNHLTVISRTKECAVTHETSLGKDDFNTIEGLLPTVHYNETDRLSSNGTVVIGQADVDFDKQRLLNYINQFVNNVHDQCILMVNAFPVIQRGRLEIITLLSPML